MMEIRKGEMYMERYCVEGIYRKKDFQSPDAGKYFDINYNMLMKELILQTKQEAWNLPAGPLSIKNMGLLYPEKVFGLIQEEYS